MSAVWQQCVMPQVGAPRRLGICCTGAVSLESVALAALANLLGHVNCPDARPTAYVEDAGLHVWLRRHRRLVQLPSPCDGEELVVDVHAVLLGLVARVHVEASPEAMIPAAIFHVVAVLSGHGQSAGEGQSAGVVRRAGAHTHSKPS